jgi:hypothetical protein
MSILVSVAAGFAVSVAAALVGERRARARRGGAEAAPAVAREPLLAVLFHVGLFAAMLAGIVANYFWVHGTAGPIDGERLWRPVLVSPIIFMPVYVAATKQPRGLIPLLIAFQNGFFWQAIFDTAGPITG